MICVPDSLAKAEAVENIKAVMNEISFAFNDVQQYADCLDELFSEDSRQGVEDLISVFFFKKVSRNSFCKSWCLCAWRTGIYFKGYRIYKYT